MLFTMAFIHEAFPNIQGNYNPDDPIHCVMTDSRIHAKQALFIPITGERFDGHHFIEDAIGHGAVCALWQKDQVIPDTVPSTFPLFLVDDTLIALQQLARKYRDQVNPTVIGITGSNGKTTTKDLVKAVTENTFKTYATKGNFNNAIGLPLSILGMKSDTDVLILEMGMNHFHEIERLSQIAQPDYAVITNIGESHIEFLGSRAGIARAKLEIKAGLKPDGKLFIDGDEELLDHVKGDEHIVTCGFSPENDTILSQVQLKNQLTSFQLDSIQFTIPILGKHHAKNASFAISLARMLGVPDKDIQHGFDNLTYTSMRFEWLTGKNQVTLINDAYNASVTSMMAAIDVVKQLDGFNRKVLVLGDILELGDHVVSFHQKVGEEITDQIDMLFTFGEGAKHLLETAKPNVEKHHFTDKQTLIKALQPLLKKDTIILFKASRGMKFEEFVTACMDMDG